MIARKSPKNFVCGKKKKYEPTELEHQPVNLQCYGYLLSLCVKDSPVSCLGKQSPTHSVRR